MSRPYNAVLTILSFSRIVVASAIIFLFDKNSLMLSWICIGLYAFGHLSDHLDGFIARRYSIPNDRGFMVDSISDKLFQIGSLIAIHQHFNISIFLLWIVIVREFAVAGLFSFIDISDAKIRFRGAVHIIVILFVIRYWDLYFFIDNYLKTCEIA
ncbi:CDP-alcohol phosphatidyltransferase family protein [uncultured Roseibium sp.]|uniref:CDP-alcohol phosphatidyltransferase family protein n=1 Tax=uncultured Roseibium sp. TaxID=1936171 RepID=UPI00374D2DC1